MPKLFKYLGIIILFHSDEHEPIHVHGRFQGFESKAEIIFENGKFLEVRIKDVRGKSPLKGKEERRFKDFVAKYREEIIQKWLDYFVYQKEIKSERITKKI